MYLMLVKLSMMLNSTTTATDGEDGKVVGGVVGDVLDSTVDYFGEQFRKSLVDFGKWLLNGLFNLLSPFITWGCRIVILWCVVTLFCTGDKKSLSTAMEFFLIYVIFLMIRSVVL